MTKALTGDARQALWAAAWLFGVLIAPEVARGAEPDVRRDPAVEAVARALPSVVNIGTETIVAVVDPFEEMLREFWGPYHGRRRATTQYSLGSGVVVDEAGYILTNDHVVRRASRIWVPFSEECGGGEYEAKLVGASRRSDVAMIKIEPKPGDRFRAVRFAADEDLWLGETVLALGNPFGLGGSVSRGILSSKSRRPPTEGAPLGLEDWLQTDAAINPGSSGGPLVNLRGDLIGLSVAVYREGQGIGFAIPVRRLVEALLEIASPELKGLWFGARVRPADGVVIVSSVERGSPAERAGLKAGDVVLSVNGKTPRGFIEFFRELAAGSDRSDTRLEVRRGGGRQEVSVRLMRESAVFNAVMIKQKLGISVQEITPDLAERLGLPVDEGLLIAAVDGGTPAARAGLQRGAVLLAVDGQAVDGVVETAKALYGRKKDEKIRVDVLVQRRRGMLLIPERAAVELPVM